MSDLPIASVFTIFFRFFNFGVGIFCARFYQGTLRRWWNSPRAKWLASGLFVVSALSLIPLTSAMNQAGGVYKDGWLYNYFVAIASGVIILSLTCPQTPFAKIMSFRLFVYLGRISYALYLIQLTAVFGLLASLPFTTGNLLLRYVAMTIGSAILYETVEKYGAKLVKSFSRRLTTGAPVQNAPL